MQSLSCSKLFTIFATLVAIIHRGLTQDLNQACQTPHGQPGRCVFLRECQPLLDIYRKSNVSYVESEFFYASRCSGTFNGKPLLCCALVSSNTSTTLPRPVDCGQSYDERILGGSEANLGEYPWMALLLYRGPGEEQSMSCAATLINARYVVTAAHCIQQLPPGWRLHGVRLGEHDTSNDGPDCDHSGCADVPVEVGVEKMIVHEEYNVTERGQYNDIALVRFDRDVGFSDYIDPVCLPLEENVRTMNHTGKHAFAAGWGITETNQASDVKRKLMLKVEDHKKCVNIYKSARVTIRDTQLCAGGIENEDTCRGDSGGPLMRSLEGHYYQIGIISWGAATCGTKDIPALYTDVAKYMDWIQDKLE